MPAQEIANTVFGRGCVDRWNGSADLTQLPLAGASEVGRLGLRAVNALVNCRKASQDGFLGQKGIEKFQSIDWKQNTIKDTALKILQGIGYNIAMAACIYGSGILLGLTVIAMTLVATLALPGTLLRGAWAALPYIVPLLIIGATAPFWGPAVLGFSSSVFVAVAIGAGIVGGSLALIAAVKAAQHRRAQPRSVSGGRVYTFNAL